MGKSGARGGGISLDLHFRKMMLALVEKWGSQTGMLHRSHLGINKNEDNDSASSQLPGEADAGGPWITL